jgi:hypothetical protein
MKGYETVLIDGGATALGYIANSLITIPFSTGSKPLDAAIDAGIGIGAVIVGFKIDGWGHLLSFAGAGWAFSAVATYAGI